MNNLNEQVKNGEITKKDAEAQLLNFRTENKEEFKAYEATQAGAEQEAKDATTSAYGANLGNTAKAADGAENAGAKPEATDADKPKMTKMQERLLKQAQQFYPEADVTLDEDGKVVVKDKKTGKIDEAKTKEAQSIKVDGTAIDTEITQDSVKPKTKVGLVDKEDAEKMRQYDTKEEAHDEFSTPGISKDDIKDAKKEVKSAEKEIKNLEKQVKKLRAEGNWEEADKLQAQINQKNEKLTTLRNDYEKMKVTGSNKGDKGIAKAAKHNAKRYDEIDNIDRVLLPGEKEDARSVPSKDNGGKTVTLSKKEANTLGQLVGYSKYTVGKYEKALKAAQEGGDPASIEKAQKDYEAALTKYGDLATCTEGGKVDVKKLQTGLAQFSGGDYNFNIDERDKLAKASGLKSGNIKSLAKKVGFGNESQLKGKFIAGATGFAATALAGLIGPHKKTATSSAHAESSVTAPDNVVVSEKTETEFYKFMDSSGNPVYKEISATAKATATAKGLTANAVADAVASATSKIPVLGQLAAPVVAGLSAFLLANPQSKDAFNGNSVDEVLRNLQTVSGNDNKKIVAKIQDMTITGDPVRDNAIKAAVIEASITGKANTEELLSAYQSLKDTKNAIEVIDKYKEPTVPPEPTPPPTPPQPTPPPEPCTDIETRSSHGDVIPSREVRGHGQSPYWIAKAYINSDGNELTPAQRKEVQKLLSKEENKQVQENGNFNGSKIGYRYRKEITLSDGTVVKLADDAAKRIGTGKMTKTRVVIKNGKQVIEEREVDCETRKPVDGPNGQWHTVKD